MGDLASGDKRRALGRGLDSLLPGRPRMVPGAGASPSAAPAPPVSGSSALVAEESSDHSMVLPELQAAAAPRDAVHQIELEKIDPNPYQTRREFDPEMLQELADSIRVNGVVQPIVVRPGASGRFVLVLGERRCRASKMAGSGTIPAIVRRVSDQQAAEMTVVENLQRQDLNCMEQGNAWVCRGSRCRTTCACCGCRAQSCNI